MEADMTREPAVAGMFYPDDKRELNGMIDGFMKRAEEECPPERYRGIIAPHAGYVYSGQTQAFSFTAEIPERVVILGVNHRGAGRPVALFGKGYWNVPNGILKCDGEISAVLKDKISTAGYDPAAHSGEHSIEVQLPFLIRKNPQALITPVLIYDYSPETAAQIGAALAEALKKYPQTLIIASSDFTHYESRKPAARQDNLASEKILAMDAEGLYKVVREKNISMCGLGPVMAMLFALRPGEVKRLFYDTSGTASGDYSSVVGYAAFAVK